MGGLAALSVAVTAIAFALADAAFSDPAAILVAGVAAVVLVGALAAHAVHRDARRLQTSEEWQRRLRGELMSQAAFLDEVVGSLAAMTSTRDAEAVLAATAEQAHRLLRPDATVVLVPSGGRDLRPTVARGIALGPIASLGVDPASPDSLLAEAAASRTPAAGPVKLGGDALTKHLRPVAALAVPLVVLDELHALLVLFRLQGEAGFGPAEVAQAVLVADFGASAAANAQLFQRVESLLAQARMRESERAELSRRILSAEQDERRKLSLFLHDGPLQAMSGIAMMLDAVAEDATEGAVESALRVLDTARERQRSVIRSLRELSFALEPWVLRDQGFVVAVRALADEMERGHAVSVDLDVEAAGELPPDDQVFLYQIVREAVQNAVKHATPRSVAVTVSGTPGSGFEVVVRDDGTGFAVSPPDDGLPHHGMTAMRERAQILGGRLKIDSVPGAGTELRVSLPSHDHADVA
ncbi:MAG TPA: GAF domain-containing sensor histidine kinase [Gaiellales bacterium]|nr:GAF domain-containing sensor histidine kinase [Gaiellales bacterium]